MDNNNVTQTIISTINNIFEQLFSSIDNNLYSTFDKITFINSDILKDNYFRNIFGTSTTNGILLIANSLLIAIIIYFAIKYFLAHFTYSKIESPKQFIFKLIIFGICMNFSYFLLEKFLDLFYDISLSIQNIGESIFQKNISFSTLINTINSTIYIGGASINIFSVNGLLKGTLTFTLLSLVFSYSFRYIMIKVFVLISPFAILSLCLDNTSWFFKAWIKNLFSLLLIQIIVSLILVILFSVNTSNNDLFSKFIYIGGIYALIKANSFVREFIGGISTNI
ncbi:unknown [Clostridium sp. CAG:440]|jgi:membrane protein|nr:unknown [Clostridium sp. CAG:440]HJJ15341.1 hypothetical protein [Clostridiaceae bacterium]